MNCIEKNNKQYLVMEELTVNKTRYVYLQNKDEEKDIIIQKIITKDNKEYLTNLKDEKEYKKAIMALQKIDQNHTSQEM